MTDHAALGQFGLLDEEMPPPVLSDAWISPDERYRYSLTRDWAGGPPVLFIMLNPSTADAHRTDPTIRRCRGFARRWGYGALVVGNLFAYRSTDPSALGSVSDPIGPENDRALLALCEGAGLIVAAWGAYRGARERTADVLRLLADYDLYCLGTTREGCPRHPLYVAGDTPTHCFAGPTLRRKKTE